MNQLIIPPHICKHCQKQLSPADNFCASCGLAVREIHAGSEVQSALIDDRTNSVSTFSKSRLHWMLSKRWTVIGILAVVGPIGLPLLWFSPRFSGLTKILVTVFYFLLTAILPLVFAWYWLEVSVRPLIDTFESRG